MATKHNLKLLETEIDKKHNLQNDFLKHILLISSSVFGILVALRQQTAHPNPYVHYMFPVVLIGLSLGILFCAVALYGSVKSQSNLVKLLKEEIREAYTEHREINPVVAGAGKIYDIAEKIGLVSLILSILLLSTYAFFIY